MKLLYKDYFKIVICSLPLILAFHTTKAQQDPLFTQYIANKIFFNPAFTAEKGTYEATMLYRTQWVSKVEGAPSTYIVSFVAPIPKYNLGVGLYYIEDKIGPTIEREITSNYSYFLNLGNELLGFGLQFGFKFLSQSLKGNIGNSNDPIYNFIDGNAWKPNFSFGAQYRTKNAFVGASIKDMLNQDYLAGQGSEVLANYTTGVHFYLTGGYFYPINERFVVGPTAIVRYVKGADVDFDFTGMVYYQEILAGGISIRSENAICFLVQGEAYRGLTIGYSYDYYHNSLRHVNSGSHEIMLKYSFSKKSGDNDNYNRVKTPRYF